MGGVGATPCCLSFVDTAGHRLLVKTKLVTRCVSFDCSIASVRVANRFPRQIVPDE
ncbi:unnamed protein product [Albugo candida]|uniref:Uncharacterized protein n=1 Tax=Albugo candida TaxID=65357 RepID=A0A024GUL6_9STRA|nr:unnamed protein product [Albugo candida]|eukprot:CCI50302.1 unnamed protein product [Albugo candida]